MRNHLSYLVVALILGLTAVQARALEQVRILVLPFSVYSEQDLTYLENEIRTVLGGDLQTQGAGIVAFDGTAEKARTLISQGPEEVRALARQQGADFVVWGSLTRVGQHFSLDTSLLSVHTERVAEHFFVEGRGMENLPASLEKLSQDMGLKIFKREKVVEVKIEGNVRIEVDAIKRVIKTKPGSVFLARSISRDLKAIYAMGYFDDVRVEAKKAGDGQIIIFHVQEKPTIRNIRFKGNHVFENDELMEGLDIKTGSILNSFKVKSNIEQIKNMYREKNYHNVEVTYKVIPREHNQADLEFDIQEGEKIRIKEIKFVGNHAYSAKKLKGLMKTSEKGFLSWLTSSGDLKMEDLKQDMVQVGAFYHNNGYIDARVAEPEIKYSGKWIYITIKIEEGPRYKVGRVDLSGDLIWPKASLLTKLRISSQEYFSREVLRNDVLVLTDIYSDAGYAYAEINPRVKRDKKNLTVDIDFSVSKGKLVYFEKIIIGGNDKTRDKVIRRQLPIYEQELYSGGRLKQGIRNLYRLEYFEDVKVDTKKGSGDDKMVVKIDVTEKSTGSFSMGAGYGTVEKMFATGSITQRNLFGRGQVLNLRGMLGSRTNRVDLSFTEPWLFDIPLSAGVDAFIWDRDYDVYQRTSTGGALRAGYPVWRYTRLTGRYLFDSSNVYDIDPLAAQSIKDLEGTNITSSISAILTYDSRNNLYNATKGMLNRLTLTYAGLGGDVGFYKAVGEVGWYFPIIWTTSGFLRGKGGYVNEAGGLLPDYERFYLGGINSVRGYDFRDISAYDADGNKVGGTSFVQFNAEYRVPLLKEQGIFGVAFFDAGNVYGGGQSPDLSDLRTSAGLGIRWLSPMGPIRLEYAFILNPEEDGPSGGKWEFGMGAAF
jgi:outer membrane protein insertion porin family